MSKSSAVKSSVKNNKYVETVVLDEEENGPVSHEGPEMDPESISHPIAYSPYVSDKNPQIDSVLDPPIKGKSIEGNLPAPYRIGEAIHPLFVNCLLDKIRGMEVEII